VGKERQNDLVHANLLVKTQIMLRRVLTALAFAAALALLPAPALAQTNAALPPPALLKGIENWSLKIC